MHITQAIKTNDYMIECSTENKPQSAQRSKHIFIAELVWSETAPYGRMLEWQSDRMSERMHECKWPKWPAETEDAVAGLGVLSDARMHMAKMAF